MPKIQVYSRPGCHLCEYLIEEILPLIRGRAELEVLNIDTQEDWQKEYGTRIPVVEIDGRFVCQYPLDREAVSAAIAGFPG